MTAGSPASRFAELAARPESDIPLDEAAILIGAHAAPGLDVAAQLRRLDDLARACPAATLDGLSSYLFDDLGFRGNREAYADPRNSYLHEVLGRRVGIPITLSVVTIEVGRRLRVPLAGVGMPGHFLVRHGGDPAVFIDPFDGGTRLDEAGCQAIFRRMGNTIPWRAEYLDVVGPRAILTRMLANLQGIFMRSDLRSAAWVLRLRLLVPGLGPGERAAIARILGSLGQFDAAGAELERVAETLPDEQAAEVQAEARALRARSN